MTDKELLEWAKEFRTGLLGSCTGDSMCFAVCAPLEGLLRCCGVDVRMVETDLSGDDRCEFYSHFWLKLSDGRALDPTADQFPDHPPIYLGALLWFHGAAE